MTIKILRFMLELIFGLFIYGAVFGDALDEYPSLWESYDPGLQSQLEDTLTELGLKRAIRAKQLGVVLADITDPHEPRVASVNGDEMFYAASLPKIAILLGAFVEIERGNMTLDRKTQNSLTQMIRVSSNVEATRMLNRVGKQNLLDILQSDEYRLYDPAVNGGLWVGKEYGKGVAYRRDPLHNLSHGATPMQAARFYYLLETGQLVNARHTRQMKSMLAKPAIHHKFVKGLDDYPDVKIYRKSGSWRRWHADSALVEANGRKYIVVALAENPSGGLWLSKMIGPLHELVVPPQIAGYSD